jgi:hypothetical protein
VPDILVWIVIQRQFQHGRQESRRVLDGHEFGL